MHQHAKDHVVNKQRPGAFIGTNLHEYLRQRGVTQVFITGIATSLGVESTARSAMTTATTFVLVLDAMTDRDADAHRLSIEKILPRLAETDTTNNVPKLLKQTLSQGGGTAPKLSAT